MLGRDRWAKQRGWWADKQPESLQEGFRKNRKKKKKKKKTAWPAWLSG